MAAPNELSFLPDDYLERKARRRSNAIWALLFCTVLGAISSAFWVTERSMREIDQQASTVDQQYTEAAKRIEQFQELQEKQRTMAHQAELTASLLEKVPRSFVLAEITNGLPAGVSLVDFVLESKQRQGAVVPQQSKTAFEVKPAGSAGASGAKPDVVPEAKLYDV